VLKNLLTIIKTQPAYFTGVIQAVIALIIGTGVTLTAAQEGAILAVTSAVLALITAASIRPFEVSTLTGFVAAMVTLLVAFGVPHVQPGIVATVNAAITAIFALVLHAHLQQTAALRTAAMPRLAERPMPPITPL
jgi:hypothetical protein